MIKIESISKEYGSLRALDQVSLSFDKGIYGILGANGAGKSTLMKILTLVIQPSGGRILFDGEDISKSGKKFLEKIGYVPQQQPVYAGFTAEEFMYYIAGLKGIDKKKAQQQTKQLLGFVHLSEEAGKKVGHFSGGMKQRLLLAQSLLGDPELILLDEPTAGVDPMERVFIRQIIEKIGKEKTVIITTHIISDIETIADGIVIMNHGKVVNSGTKEELITEYETDSLENVYMKIFGVR